MRRRTLAVVFVFCLFLVAAIPATAAPKVLVDGQELDVSVSMENGTTLVPLRAIFQALGATVNWDGSTQTIVANKDQTEVKLQIGQKTAYRNGESVSLEVPGKIIKESTMVPLRFVSEALGASVGWDGSTQTITIINETTPTDELKEVGEVEWEDKSYPEGIVSTKDNEYYLNMNMVLDHYPAEYKANLEEMQSVNYNNEKYVLFPELLRFFDAHNLGYSFSTSLSGPEDMSLPGDPDWFKEVGKIEWAGQSYPGALVVSKDDVFYLAMSMLVEQYPENSSVFESMDSKEYQGERFINEAEVMEYLDANGLGYDYTTYIIPPTN